MENRDIWIIDDYAVWCAPQKRCTIKWLPEILCQINGVTKAGHSNPPSLTCPNTSLVTLPTLHWGPIPVRQGPIEGEWSKKATWKEVKFSPKGGKERKPAICCQVTIRQMAPKWGGNFGLARLWRPLNILQEGVLGDFVLFLSFNPKLRNLS